jgi:hypothetical protein
MDHGLIDRQVDQSRVDHDTGVLSFEDGLPWLSVSGRWSKLQGP